MADSIRLDYKTGQTSNGVTKIKELLIDFIHTDTAKNRLPVRRVIGLAFAGDGGMINNIIDNFNNPITVEEKEVTKVVRQIADSINFFLIKTYQIIENPIKFLLLGHFLDMNQPEMFKITITNNDIIIDTFLQEELAIIGHGRITAYDKKTDRFSSLKNGLIEMAKIGKFAMATPLQYGVLDVNNNNFIFKGFIFKNV